MSNNGLSNSMTVVGLVNGMIGGIILVMPILSIKTGFALIAPIAILSGLFSYFSSSLCLRHLRNYADLDQAVLRHFGGKRGYKIFYDATICVSMTVLLILYFGLICQQWIGMTSESHLIPILNALALFPIVYIMKKYHFGASLLAYGILSIIGYCVFLIWMRATAPEGDKQVPATDPLFVDLAAALAQGFAIQTFFIPILKQNKNRRNYSALLILTYVIGTVVYTYIGYIGAYSIINREASVDKVITIEDYFGEKQWEVITLEIIYLVHLYSAFPEFLLVAKKRFFSIFRWPETDDVTFKEVIYVAATIFISLIIRLTQIKAEILIEINGSIVSFFFIYVIPIGLHIKCVYFSTPEERQHKLSTEEKEQKALEQSQKGKDIEMPKVSEHGNSQEHFKEKMKHSTIIKKKREDQLSSIDSEKDPHAHEQQPEEAPKQFCQCQIQFRSKAHEVCEIVLMVLMLLSGLMTMVYTVITIAQD